MDDTIRSTQRVRPERVNGHQNKLTGTKLTRRRIPLSCQACRVRKLKCNREKPCQNCIVRGDVAITTCSYADKNDGRVQSSSTSKPDQEDMRARINRLENSILSMISKEKRNTIPSLSPSVEEDNDDHVGQAGGQKPSVDTRSTHWDSILNDVSTRNLMYKCIPANNLK